MHHLARCAILCVALGASTPIAAQTFEYRVEKQVTHDDYAAGVRFSIDSLVDAGPAPGVFKTFEAMVAFAHGRGRLDVIGTTDGPVLRADGVTIGPPLGQAGDYYLFDSTGFILVRPSNKTFSSFVVDSASYGYQYTRDGWPQYFRFGKVQMDTLSGNGNAAVLATRGPTRAFWHLDLEVDTSPTRVVGRDSTRILAAGRSILPDAPRGEFSVARWFGPSEALANLPAGTRDSLVPRMRITAVAELPNPEASRRPVDFITLHQITRLASAAIDLARLTLPDGFTETRWPGFEALTGGLASPDQSARWRKAP